MFFCTLKYTHYTTNSGGYSVFTVSNESLINSKTGTDCQSHNSLLLSHTSINILSIFIAVYHCKLH